MCSDGTLSDVDGELFIKPCTAAEVAFYETSITEHPEFAQYMPTYLGTLTLSNNQSLSIKDHGAALVAELSAKPVVSPGKKVGKKIATNTALVLENATAGFKRANILDVKLGVRLWADDAAQEKKDRFDKVTEETTHKKFGFRIAGMRVWQGPGTSCGGPDVDEEGFRNYDKDYGRYTINNDNVSEAFREFLFCESAGIDRELSQILIQAFLTDLEDIRKTLESQESRMYSASLLLVYEGDGQALRAAMEEASKPSRVTNGVNGVNGHHSDHEAADEGLDHDDIDDDDYDEDEEEGPKIYCLKVIDFAHAEWVPGMGPDENSLLGVRSVVDILERLGQQS